MKNISMLPIGTIYSPHIKIEGIPIQPAGAEGIKGEIVLEEEFKEGLKDLEGFSHIILLYQFHKIETYQLQLIPFMDSVPHGIFATHSPKRPNRIGISIVKLIRIENDIICFEGADMLNETPLLDIKPFFGKYDNQINVKNGWLDGVGEIDIKTRKSDNRFN